MKGLHGDKDSHNEKQTFGGGVVMVQDPPCSPLNSSMSHEPPPSNSSPFLTHLYLGAFSHSSLQILSSFVRLDGECSCTAIFRAFQRWSIVFKAGRWLGNSRTLSRIHSCFVLAVCSYCPVGQRPQFEVLSVLEQVFIKDLSVLCSINLSLDPD